MRKAEEIKKYANSIIKTVQKIELRQEHEYYNDLLDGIYDDCEKIQEIIGDNYEV